MSRVCRIATRGSKLALVQTQIVADLLKKIGVETEVITVTTKGDRDRVNTLQAIGGDGLFVREVEKELVSGRADIAVHSGKDLPYRLAEGTCIGGVPGAADGRECLITVKGRNLCDIHTVGTGSVRRKIQLEKLLPGIHTEEIRGNIETRLRKLSEGKYDAILLAKAGLDRAHIDLSDYSVTVYSSTEFLPAACQGLIGIQCRTDDEEMKEILEKITDPDAMARFVIERELFCALQADCKDAIAVRADLTMGYVMIRAIFGKKRVERRGPVEYYQKMCAEMAAELRAAQAAEEKEQETSVSAANADAAPGMVTLVGAGCGHDLITLKGLKKIKEADVIMYDDLMDWNLLLEARQDCELIYVGKRLGKHYLEQSETNAVLIREAKKGKNIVRLKGGDSFVFGRGGEEILELQKEGISYEVIPGVTSGTAVPGHAGIPVTHRRTAQSVTMITGHTATDKEENYEALAKLDGTLVFFMGLGRVREIAAKLVENGKPAATPASIVSHGFSADEKRVDGTLENIGDLAETVKAPALFIVGETADMHLESNVSLPLSHVSVTITGTTAFVKKTGLLLEKTGAQVDLRPCLRILPEGDEIPESFREYSWAVFTSENGVEQFFAAIRKRGTDYRELSNLKFACLGAGTSERLRDFGFHADFIPNTYTARELGRQMGELLRKSERVLILRAENGSPDLTEELDAAGIGYTDVVVYRTGVMTEQLRDLHAETDYIIFGSAFGTRTYLANADYSEHTKPVVIGPSTLKELIKHTDGPYLMPAVHTSEGILNEILKDVQNR